MYYGLYMLNLKIQGIRAYTPGTTPSHPGLAGCVGLEFMGQYLEPVWRKETSSIKGGREDRWADGTTTEICRLVTSRGSHNSMAL